MADTQHAPGHGGHDEHADHGDVFRIYMIVAVALAVCTASSFIFNTMARNAVITAFISFLLILAVAIIKAVLVGMYFMHLKWDWKMLYFLIVPVFIMGVMMMVVLLPDTVLGPRQDATEAIQAASSP